MAEEQFKTRQEAQAKLVTALQENSRKLRKAYQDNDKAAINKFSKEYDRITSQLRASSGIGVIGSGMASTAVGLLTGIPDLGITAYNYFAEPRTPVQTLRERLLSVAQIPTQAVAQEDQLTYAAPDIATGVVGLAQLTRLGASGVKNWLQNRQTKDLLSKLSPEERNFFQDLMLKGQGSPNAEVAATLARIEKDPKYAELFNTLKREASTRATAGVAPARSRITEEQAGIGAAMGVKNKIDGLAEARKVAGDSAFTQAFGYAEGRQLVDPVNTIKEIDNLIGRYSKRSTPNAERAVEVLQSVKDRLSAVSAPASPFAGVGGGAQPSRLKTAEEVQAVLSEFGKKASQGDSLIKDLALSDEKIISSAIFGGMKDDLALAAKNATGNDKVALNFLIKARKDISDASTKYNDAIAQGLPAFLKDKPLNSINFEDLYAQYKSATPAQRATFRSYIQNTDPESLKNFDSRVWQDFSGKYATTLDDGMPGTDLAKMAQDWAKTPAQEKDAIATALGQNLDEFDKRMKDALVFTRRVSTGQPAEDGQKAAQMVREGSAVVGAGFGYQAAKGAQLAGDTVSIFRKGGISNDLAMRTLLTPEGAAFLKNAKLSPGSQKTLEALTAVNQAPLALPSWMAVGTSVAPQTQGQPVGGGSMAPEDTWVDPDQGDAANENVRKFLDTIAQAEGGDYNIIVGGGRFQDFSQHPGIVGMVTDRGPSTAAGRYQITQSTYNDLAKKMGVSGFGPETQDAMAIQLLKDRGAYQDVLSGDFETAKNKLRSTWEGFNKQPAAPSVQWVDPDEM